MSVSKLVILVVVFFVILCFLYVFFNLGKFLDVTKEAVPSDIIVSFGGPSGIRLQKALELYKKDYSRSNKIIYTGSNNMDKSYSSFANKFTYLLNSHVKKENIIHIDGSIISNTMEEIFFVKKYLLEHGLKSVIFVSHPQHSRRITVLANVIAGYKENGIKLIVVSCESSSWNKKEYYKKKSSFVAALSESLKLIYNLIKYSPFLFKYTELNKKLKYE